MEIIDYLQEIIDYLQEFNIVSVILRMLLATFLGALIGLERASKGQTAGVRTFALVCLGSVLATVANLYLFEVTENTDTARIPAAVAALTVPVSVFFRPMSSSFLYSSPATSTSFPFLAGISIPNNPLST